MEWRRGAVFCLASFLFLCGLLFISGTNAITTKNEIHSLPGYPRALPSRQYSGYVSVGQTRSLFYWFSESASKPESDPLVLWLTGGPGCSSLFALMTENGPFRTHTASQLDENLFSWSRQANVIWVESPCGVGFSFATDGNYTTGDEDTANQNYLFVQEFLTRLFPEYLARKQRFFVAGESYAGHYVPQLSRLLYKDPVIRQIFEGFSAGNPSTDRDTDYNLYFPFIRNHALISNQDYDYAAKACGAPDWVDHFNVPQCQTALQILRTSMNRINPYNIYAPCVGYWSNSGGCFTLRDFSSSSFISDKASAPFSASVIQDASVGSQTVIPCINDTATTLYFQRADVQKTLGVVNNGNPIKWNVCSSILNYTSFATSVLPIYQELHTHLRIIVYSGDVDSCVPFQSTEAAIDKLNLTLASNGAWRAWFDHDKQVAGYIKTFGANYPSNGISYATIKDAGHMCPTYKPIASSILFNNFINRQPLPYQ